MKQYYDKPEESSNFPLLNELSFAANSKLQHCSQCSFVYRVDVTLYVVPCRLNALSRRIKAEPVTEKAFLLSRYLTAFRAGYGFHTSSSDPSYRHWSPGRNVYTEKVDLTISMPRI